MLQWTQSTVCHKRAKWEGTLGSTQFQKSGQIFSNSLSSTSYLADCGIVLHDSDH